MTATHHRNAQTARRLIFTPWTASFLLNVFAISALAAYVINLVRENQQIPGRSSQQQEVSLLRNRLDWQKEKLPDFCQQIKNYPQPKRNCSTDPPVKGAPTCDPDRPMMYSQYGEDYYLYTRHFSKYTKPGVYLDVAANDARQISSTYFLDRCLSWKGICVEANPKYYAALHRYRSCALVPTCVSEKDYQLVQFAMSGPGGGILETHRRARDIEQIAESIVELRCVSLMSQLQRYDVRAVDFFSLDVEGHEMTVMRSFDWDSVLVKIVSIEISGETEAEINSFLVSKGFQLHDSERPTGTLEGMPMYRASKIYVHKSVVFGQPEQ